MQELHKWFTENVEQLCYLVLTLQSLIQGPMTSKGGMIWLGSQLYTLLATSLLSLSPGFLSCKKDGPPCGYGD